MSRLEQLRKLAEATPDDPFAHYAVGLELFNQGAFGDAVSAFATALAKDPNYIPAYYHQARAEIRTGDSAAATRTLTTGIDVAEQAGDAKTAREMRELLETIQ